MAHTVRFASTKTPGLALIAYNIARSVGATGINIPVDVKLVQALLRMFFSELEVSPPPALFARDGPLVIDGKLGPITQAHIREFKDFMRRGGKPTIADGKIDPFVTPRLADLTPRSRQVFVLVQLNASCDFHANRQGKDALFADLPRRLDMPEDLRTALRTEVLEL